MKIIKNDFLTQEIKTEITELKKGVGKNLPSDLIEYIFSFIASENCHTSTNRLLREKFYRRAWEHCKNHPNLQMYVPQTEAQLSNKESIDALKITLFNIKKYHRESKTDAHFKNCKRPLLLNIPCTLNIIENAELIKLYPYFTKFIPPNRCPELSGNLHQKAETIRSWMQKEKAAFGQITVLDLSQMDLSLLPKEIKYFTHLRRLYLNDNRLITLPDEIGEMRDLRRLFLQSNNIKELPSSIGNLINLFDLHLMDNSLHELPDSIGNLINLHSLDLGNNLLVSLPKTIGNLKHLEWLGAQRNFLTSLPKEIGGLKNLQILDLHSNALKSIPKEINELEELQALYLFNNQLKEIPKGLLRLKRLLMLYIYDNDNPLQSILDELPYFGGIVI